jgi:calcium/calmodulin-dependent protein kinase I
MDSPITGGIDAMDIDYKRNVKDFYDFGDVLGQGSFSVVMKARNKKTGEAFAVKCLKKSKIRDLKRVKEREIAIMRKVKNSLIVSLLDVFEDDVHIYLILELVTGGELFQKIIESGHFSEEKATKIAKQVLEAINYLHSHDIVHRDLKPENLLCVGDDASVIRVADFGFARVLQDDQQTQTQCGSIHYTAPEIISGDSYGKACDMWSIGVIIYALLTGCFPFDDDDPQKMLDRIDKARYIWPKEPQISASAQHLVQHLLVRDPSKRYTAEQALSHPWIQSKDVSTLKFHTSYVNLLDAMNKKNKQMRTS